MFASPTRLMEMRRDSIDNSRASDRRMATQEDREDGDVLSSARDTLGCLAGLKDQAK